MGSIRQRSFWSFEPLWAGLREHAESLLLALFAALLLRWLVVSAFVIQSDGMAPTLRQGDFVLGYKLPFGIRIPGESRARLGGRLPQRGEMVLFPCPAGEQYWCLKRVVGVPGDRIELRRQRLVINQQVCRYRRSDEEWEGMVVLQEECHDFEHQIGFPSKWPEESWGPVLVPPGQVFVLSDSREDQNDSRSWGPMDWGLVQATPILVMISLDWTTGGGFPLIRSERLLRTLN